MDRTVINIDSDTGPTEETREEIRKVARSGASCVIRISEVDGCDPELLELLELEVVELAASYDLSPKRFKVEVVDVRGQFKPKSENRGGKGSACLVMASLVGTGALAAIAAIVGGVR